MLRRLGFKHHMPFKRASFRDLVFRSLIGSHKSRLHMHPTTMSQKRGNDEDGLEPPKRLRPSELKPSNALDFFLLCGKLKTTKRTGWVHNKVVLPESISDHMHRMATMAFLCDDPNVSQVHCIKMALVHDLAESMVGDITPHCGVSDEEKAKREDDAMKHIRDVMLEGSEVGHEMYSLWREYEDAQTPAAKFVKDLDKFEMIVQAYEYEKAESRGGDLESFFKSTRGKFRSPMVQKWVEQLERRRETLKEEKQEEAPKSSTEGAAQ